MGLLYRFRHCNDQLISNVMNLSIEGSKYCTMKDKREVSFTINLDLIKKVTSLSAEEIFSVQENVRKHILNSYFISCFCKTDQINEMSMWAEYTGYDGFCLLYEEEHIKTAIVRSMMKHKDRFFMFDDVDYGTESTDITPFLFNYLRLIGNDFNNEKACRLASSRVKYLLSLKEREKIMKSMFHKIGDFPEDNEKRIVLFGKETDKEYSNSMIPVKIKPIKIICSSLMPTEKRKQLEHFANTNKIGFLIKEVKR